MLTDTLIRKVKPSDKPYKLTDSGGLYLDVRPTGQRFWRYRFSIDGKESIFTIGEYPEVSLADARMKRDQARQLVKAGRNPTGERKAEEQRSRYAARQTFGAVLDDWLENRDWTESTRRNREGQINLHIRPHLDAMPIREITPMMILDVLRRAEAPGTVTKTTGRGARTRQTGGGGVSRRLRQYISGVFELAVITHRADTNPAGPLRGALTKARKTIHKTPLTPEQIGVVLRAVDNYPGSFLTKYAFRLMWWTLARPAEAAGAHWDEFDLDAGLWVVPPERMKGGEEHRIPLPRQAVDAMRGLKEITGGYGHCFPHRDNAGTSMTRDALTNAARNMKLGFEYSPHATRTTGSTILNEQGWRFDVIEKQLAHQERDSVRRAYNRTIYLQERAEMMQSWADQLDAWKAGAAVLPIRRKTA